MKTKLKGLKTILLSLFVMALWGSLYPFVKIGYNAFEIDGADIPSILMFAGVRFAICGLILCVVAYFKKDKIEAPKTKTIGVILLIGLFAIILHYSFTYVGLSSTDSSKTALIKQLGALLYVCFAFLFFKSEKFSVLKIVGAVIGFLGIVAINFNPNGITFTTGDILIILASICLVVSNIFNKAIAKNNSPFWINGVSQLFGGAVLIIVAFCMGGSMLNFNLKSTLVFSYICVASMAGYVLWNYVLKTCDLSNLFIIKFAEPMFACVFGAILLKEDIFKWQYLIAFVLISIGIILGNYTKKEKVNKIAKVFEIKRLAVHDGDGLRTTVFLKGCPLKCVWCHNPEGLSTKQELAYHEHKCINCGECISVCPTGAHKMENGVHIFEREKCIACGKCESVCLGRALTFYGKEYTAKELLPLLLEDKAFYDNSGGGVTISGGECLLYADFCAELLALLKQNGVNTAVDTCGLVSKESLQKVMPYTDVFLYDVKAIDESVHINCTGQSNKQILENLKFLDESGAKIEIRLPYVPGLNDNQTHKIGKFLSELKNITKVRVLPYHNYAGSKYKSLNILNTLPSRLPTDEEIESAVIALKSYGLNAI